MNGTPGFQARRSSTPDHHHIGYGTSNSLNLGLVPGIFSVLTISSVSPQTSAQREKRFLTPFSCTMLIAWLLLIPCLPGISQAQVPPPTGPITSSGLNTIVTTNGNVHDITGGRRPGGASGTNLFHSFGEFGVPANNIANFLNETALPTTNILARVTGTNGNNPTLSSIYGTIRTTDFGNANLFLMNPAGFLFGPNATVNVGGMVAFTSADYLNLTDNARFNAIPNAGADALLTALPVASFGFLGSNPGAITVQGSQFSVTDGQSISLVGGNIVIESGTPEGGTTQPARLMAPGGQINLASVASPGEVSAGDFIPTSGMTMDNIALSQGAILDVSGDGGGTVRIRGGQFIMDQAAVIANTTGVDDGAPTAISVNVTGGVLLNNQSALVAQATNAGRGGDIEITGRTIDVAGTSVVYTASTDSGSPGNITVTASESISVRGADQFGNPSEILSDSLFMASTGSIALRSPLITLEMGAVETRMFGFGTGARAGDIMIDTTNLNLLSGGMIRTTSGSDIAPSGNISITAGEAVNLIGTNDFNTTSNITNENTNGGTGNISIQTGTLTLIDQSRINSQTWFDADPAAANQAKISVTADSIMLSTGSRIDVGGFFSDTGRLDLSAQNLTMSGVSAITTLSNASGASGPILINVQDLAVTEGSQIVSSSGQGFGRGGDITVNATGSVLVTGQGTDPFGGTVASGIFSNTFGGFEDPSLTGNAGNISITGHSIEVSNGARVDSSSQFFALGNAGNIDLMAPTITVNGGTISTSTEFAGQAGTITLHADTVTLSNNGQLASSSIVRQTPFFEGEVIPLPTGNAGTVTIQGLASSAQSALIDGSGSGIFTDTQGTGAGGNIFVNANSVTLQNGGTLSASSSGTGNAGNISILADQVSLTNLSKVNTSTSGEGAGGSIHVSAEDTISAVDSFISANSNSTGPGAGNGGQVILNAPTIDVVGGDISTLTVGSGNAGDIQIQAGTFRLGASENAFGLVEATTSGSGHGGNISILGIEGPGSRANDVILSDFSSLRSETLTDGAGTAGNITVDTVRLTLTEGSEITTASHLNSPGNAGNVTLDANESVLVSGSFVASDVFEASTGNGGKSP